MPKFNVGPLNHVGVAVPDIDAAIAMYREKFGVTDITEPKDLPPQGVTYAFVNLPSGQVELITPYGDNSPITKYLERNPKGGQHHLCFEVEDIREAVTAMETRGMRVLNEPRIGAHGTLVVFLHPGDAGGVLIELMETPKADASHA
ncbi:methylmalonyl-CoA epimerase [Fretibacter rubidus]|uniref:methylmalonyl-CoA epimerase n=1 Tax=Fretibacter rubidus TaxID=570162 RepID=UPI00352A2038